MRNNFGKSRGFSINAAHASTTSLTWQKHRVWRPWLIRPRALRPG